MRNNRSCEMKVVSVVGKVVILNGLFFDVFFFLFFF